MQTRDERRILPAVSLLLPQVRAGTIRAVTPVNIHGDRYVDVSLSLDEATGRPLNGRVAAGECPADLAAGDRVNARFVMGLMVKITRV